MSRSAIVVTALLASLTLAPVAAAAPAATTCTASTLPMPPGGTDSHIAATNGDGVYVGTVGFSTTSRKGAIWRNGGVEVLDTWFSPTGMNSSGLMSGQALAGNSRTRASMLQLDGQIQYLGEADSGALDINENGDIVGLVPVYRGSLGVAWPASNRSGFSLTPYGRGSATAIDDDGWMIGSYTYTGPTTEYIWRLEGNSYQRIREYHPDENGDNPIDLYDVDDGQVVATRDTGTDTEIVVIDAATGAIRAVPNTTGALPDAINNGIIIGSDYYAENPPPTMWRNGETVRLPSIPGGRPWGLSTVNENGTEITGNSVRDAGGTIATVWRCSPPA